MAYTTGYASTAAQLLDGIQTGALAGGWTTAHRGPDTGGGTLTGFRADVLWMTNGSCCLGFSMNQAVSPIHEIQCYWASSFNGSLQYSQQAGFGSVYSHWVWIPCRKWHVFSGADYIYVVVEGLVNSFRHFGGGKLTKLDDYVGGGFIYSHRSYSSNTNYVPFHYRAYYHTLLIRAAGDGYAEQWRTNVDAFPSACYGSLWSDEAMTDQLITGQTNQLNRQTILVPLYSTILRVSGAHSLAGYPPDLRACNVKYLDPAGETITLGPDSWMCFPLGLVGSSDPRDDPVNKGLAYKVG